MEQHVIGIFGRKGGTGKTMISHMLAHGMTRLGRFTCMVQTDVRGRTAEVVDGRDYILAQMRNDGSERQMMEAIFKICGGKEKSVIIIDGGANRRAADLAFARFVDIILIPTGYGHEDLDMARTDYYELKDHLRSINSAAQCFIVRNRWPGVSKKREAVESKPWVGRFYEESARERNLYPDFIPDMPSMLDLSNAEDPKYTLLINQKAESFARRVGNRIGMIWEDEQSDKAA